jgi:hypothetical protein
VIYSDIAATLADARQYASSQAQLRFLDLVVEMIAETLSEYNKFNHEYFLEKCKLGYDVYAMTDTNDWR